MRRALVIGGTGLIGRAVARRLIRDGWRVTVTGRDPRRAPADLSGVFFRSTRDVWPSGDHELVVDCACYTAEHARQSLPLMRGARSAVMISSKAVYVDEYGNHVNSAVPPRFTGPVREDQPTLPPGDMLYDSPEGYGPNKVAAEQVLLDSGAPVTVLRASKVHGEGAVPARTWWFVKRALDRRPVVLLAGRGRGVDHPTAATDIAALIARVADRPGRRVLNVADPIAADGLTIARIVAAELGHSWREVLLAESSPLGRHPFHRLPGIVLDTSAAAALGHVPEGDLTAEIRWLVSHPPATDPAGWFDYAAEDAAIA
ncbi:NAD-dependent epimerase/dehydratase family protein [Actinoplanes sp. NPDC049802]|uniref:NAD-dependent epimerase/dehydratase family protein n=1 Tax=Actinoplanes sp. NPDC049802 TaxID=3154742 RepID=UPI0033D22B7E